MDQNQKKRDLRGALESFLKLHRISIPVIIVLTAAVAVSFFLAINNDFDFAIGHFDSSSAAFTVLKISAIAAAVISCVLALAAQKSVSFADDPSETPITVFAAILSAAMSIIGLVSSAVDIALGAAVDRFGLIAAILLPFIGVSMILSIVPAYRHSRVRQISAILAALSVNFSMFSDYFNFTLPLNSPIRSLVTVMKGAALLYLLSEARFSFGKKCERATVPFFLFTSGVTGSVSLGYSLGATAYSLITPAADNPNPSVISLALYAAIGIHALGRFAITAKSAGEAKE